MLVVVLLIVWVVALAPFALRKRNEWALGASINRFGYRRRVFNHRYAAYGVPATLGRPSEEDPATREARRGALRAERQRISRLRARRRMVLARLVLAVAGCLILGAIPALRPLWDLALAGLFAAIAYGAAIVRLARNEEYRLHPPARPVIASPVPPETHGGVVVPLRPARPAFVIVEATS